MNILNIEHSITKDFIPKNFINAKNINVNINGNNIVNNANIKLQTGKINILLGPNGAGKTTLLKAILGIIKSENSKIFYNDALLDNMPLNDKALLIGYLGQIASLEWDMKVEDLISLGRIPHQNAKKTTRSKDIAIINNIMEQLNISKLKNKNINSISGGELALCLMARVLTGEPKFIFADEPFNHLDIARQIEIGNIFRQFANNGGGVIATVHDLSLAASIGDYFTLINNGEIIASGTRNEVITHENIEKAYNIKVKILDKDGDFIIIPQISRI